jgi:hypothetical protein
VGAPRRSDARRREFPRVDRYRTSKVPKARPDGNGQPHLGFADKGGGKVERQLEGVFAGMDDRLEAGGWRAVVRPGGFRAGRVSGGRRWERPSRALIATGLRRCRRRGRGHGGPMRGAGRGRR